MGLFRKKSAPARVPYTAAVIVAAGSATRMGGVDKILAPIGLEPAIVRAVRPFQSCDCIREIVVVTREDLLVDVSRAMHMAHFDKVTMVVCGGATRAESVSRGLDTVSKKTKLAAIHDGARPFVTEDVIERAVRAAAKFGAAAPAIPVKDTIKRAESGLVLETPDRSTLFAVQTPQVFRTEEIRSVLRCAIAQGLPLTDDCSAMEAAGRPVRLTPGDVENLKITTPVDLRIAEAIWKGRTT